MWLAALHVPKMNEIAASIRKDGERQLIIHLDFAHIFFSSHSGPKEGAKGEKGRALCRLFFFLHHKAQTKTDKHGQTDIKTGTEEQRTESREQGTGNREQRTRNRGRQGQTGLVSGSRADYTCPATHLSFFLFSSRFNQCEHVCSCE